jgi:hypothetical protein
MWMGYWVGASVYWVGASVYWVGASVYWVGASVYLYEPASEWTSDWLG